MVLFFIIILPTIISGWVLLPHPLHFIHALPSSIFSYLCLVFDGACGSLGAAWVAHQIVIMKKFLLKS